jgi:thiol-disulfide isomerase/thioredoxin
VVLYYNNSKGPCKSLSPKLESLSLLYPDIQFIKVDVDKFQDLAKIYSVTAMPTIVFIRALKEIDRVVGADLNRIKQIIVAGGRCT